MNNTYATGFAFVCQEYGQPLVGLVFWTHSLIILMGKYLFGQGDWVVIPTIISNVNDSLGGGISK